MLSRTEMVCVKVFVIPQASVAVQARVMLLLQDDPGLLSVWTKLTRTGPPQLLVAVTVGGGGTSA
jgi:hypothetical protein